ncbi:septal ring lytic transglycosylase RlpA family protein [Mesonia maritima]|uniref:Probable endolytic peptidoglycan transglycosylase RlpA n=1 Tax=Mesonia maritima TaxID=1793873 RepID=A0ABU1K989_9FLAO|nr:septal ring lytic transglycosylase RlpA family protein [Mesonia maritima]MDR6302160.1 rare lipoprotein A [Mesonia maritima]
MKQLFSSLLIFLICCHFALAQVQTGKASYYSNKFEGRLTASGEKYSHEELTAAHRHLPFGTKIRVTNLANDTSIVVEINDRGPFVSNRIIDLSQSAAKKLDFMADGVTDVVLEVVGSPEDDLTTFNSTEALAENEKTEESTINTEGEKSVKKMHEFYEMSVNRVQPDWFGIQIGSFQEVANLIRLADNLKISYQQDITVQVKDVQGVKVYTLIIGKFETRNAAEDFKKEEVSTKYPDSFIIDFERITSS